MHLITDEQTIADPNVVKVVVNLQHEAPVFQQKCDSFKKRWINCCELLQTHWCLCLPEANIIKNNIISTYHSGTGRETGTITNAWKWNQH